MARILIFTLMLFAFVSAGAQSLTLPQINDTSFQEIAKLEKAMLKDSLSLSEQQLTGIDSVLGKYFAGVAGVPQGHGPDERASALAALEADLTISLDRILTSVQMEQYKALTERRKTRRRPHSTSVNE